MGDLKRQILVSTKFMGDMYCKIQYGASVMHKRWDVPMLFGLGKVFGTVLLRDKIAAAIGV